MFRPHPFLLLTSLLALLAPSAAQSCTGDYSLTYLDINGVNTPLCCHVIGATEICDGTVSYASQDVAGRRRRAMVHKRQQLLLENPCPSTQRACALASGNFECVDHDELTSCGGCVSDGSGVDCLSLEGYVGVGCVEGQCVAFHLPPLEPFEHVDPGHKALNDANPRSFLDGAKVSELTPGFGSKVKGIQLSQLSTHDREQLALFVAQRGVVVFRDQDFLDQDSEWQLRDWGAFFGRLHTHPTSGAPKGIPEFHLIHRHNNKADFRTDGKLVGATWHSDVTYELQPPGITTLFLYDTPAGSGGDTSFVSLVAAYKKLSPSFAGYLETLSAVHSGFEQAEFARTGGGRGNTVRREPVKNVHPLIRRHPVTGEKSIFVNRGFTRSIVGLKAEESSAILETLYKLIAEGVDLAARARWKPRTVVVWDNRVTVHSATVDWDSQGEGGRRHGARITPQAERPFL